MPESNDQFQLRPASPPAEKELTFDFPGLSIGHAEYEEGPTGCTVFLFDRGWSTAVDKRGGWVGTAGDYEFCHGLCFAGGSLLGLEAASGVTAELWARNEYSTERMPLVNGAIIWDYGARKNRIYPDRELGRAAARAAVPGTVAIGRRGAGRSATVGKMKYIPEPGGQGAAYREFAGAKILVVTVVNALGAIIDRNGKVVRGNLDQTTGERRRTIDILAPGARSEATIGTTQNTTLTLLATDAKLSNRELKQFGRQVHTSMARAIDPFQTLQDGDTLFAVTSNSAEATASADTLAMVASEVAWDAVLSIVE